MRLYPSRLVLGLWFSVWHLKLLVYIILQSFLTYSDILFRRFSLSFASSRNAYLIFLLKHLCWYSRIEQTWWLLSFLYALFFIKQWRFQRQICIYFQFFFNSWAQSMFNNFVWGYFWITKWLLFLFKGSILNLQRIDDKALFKHWVLVTPWWIRWRIILNEKLLSIWHLWISLSFTKQQRRIIIIWINRPMLNL